MGRIVWNVIFHFNERPFHLLYYSAIKANWDIYISHYIPCIDAIHIKRRYELCYDKSKLIEK